MIVDAITHSPLWASSLVFITEDNPSQGGEHFPLPLGAPANARIDDFLKRAIS